MTNITPLNAPDDRSDRSLVRDGNWLFGCTASLFCELAKDGAEFASMLKNMHREYWGKEPEKAEVRSWEHSLPEIADIISSAGLNGQLVILEYCPPAQDKYPTRIDVVIGGIDENNVVNFLFIELKQWTDFIPTFIPGMIHVRIGQEKTLKKHPLKQVEEYRCHMQHVLDACRIPQSYMRFSAYAYLHNVEGLSDVEKAALFNKEHHNDDDSKMYTKDFAGALVNRLKERVGRPSDRAIETLRDIQKRSVENRERLPARSRFYLSGYREWKSQTRKDKIIAGIIVLIAMGLLLAGALLIWRN